jgi:hypothetical protein
VGRVFEGVGRAFESVGRVFEGAGRAFEGVGRAFEGADRAFGGVQDKEMAGPMFGGSYRDLDEDFKKNPQRFLDGVFGYKVEMLEEAVPFHGGEQDGVYTVNEPWSMEGVNDSDNECDLNGEMESGWEQEPLEEQIYEQLQQQGDSQGQEYDGAQGYAGGDQVQGGEQVNGGDDGQGSDSEQGGGEEQWGDQMQGGDGDEETRELKMFQGGNTWMKMQLKENDDGVANVGKVLGDLQITCNNISLREFVGCKPGDVQGIFNLFYTVEKMFFGAGLDTFIHHETQQRQAARVFIGGVIVHYLASNSIFYDAHDKSNDPKITETMETYNPTEKRHMNTRLAIAAHVFKVPDEQLDTYLNSFKGVGQVIWVYNKNFPQNWVDAKAQGDNACALYRTLVRLAIIQYQLRVLQQPKGSDDKDVLHKIKFLCAPTTKNILFIRKVCKHNPCNTIRKRMSKQLRYTKVLINKSPWKRSKVV